MATVRNVVIGLLIGFIFGIWIGVNIGKDKPYFSNPFKEKSVNQKLKDTGKDLLKEGGKFLEESGEKIQKKLEAEQ